MIQEHCYRTVTYDVFDLYGGYDREPITQISSQPLPSVTVPYQGRIYGYVADPQRWNEFREGIHSRMNIYNQQIEILYPLQSISGGLGMLTIPEFQEYQPIWDTLPPQDGTSPCEGSTRFSIHHSFKNNCPDINSPDLFEEMIKDMKAYIATHYCTRSNLLDETVYVVITTPGGSTVQYSYPIGYLTTMMRSSFIEGEAPLLLEPTFITPEGGIGEEEYHDILAKALVGNGTEILSFKFAIDDFEGRNVLRPVIRQAILLAAAQQSEPVLVFLRGVNRNQEVTIASMTADQESFTLLGAFFGGAGAIHGSGGGATMEASYTTHFEDITYGPILMYP